jgi:hypothetical protein
MYKTYAQFADWFGNVYYTLSSPTELICVETNEIVDYHVDVFELYVFSNNILFN